ncbi:unnamed protein product [Lactuca saligna]|uniref:Reverse transcriptase zinc-binding domain-containing protein n=1 Tax=Lactuca saligna TaxID=75948 RepID=A0AA35YHJ9_LACSI|nr:unnamed protein product [Lactuca saligna]
MSLHGTDGGIGCTMALATRGGTWGAISHLHLYLMRNQVDINDLLIFQDKKWKWIEDNEGCFTVASCRKTIDNHLLICLEDSTLWNKILPVAESHLFLNCLVAREVRAAIKNWWNQVPVDNNSLHDYFGCVSSSGTPGLKFAVCWLAR